MPAFDDLCRFLKDTNKPWTAARAASALGFLGTNALPPLLAIVPKAGHPARLRAIRAIGQMFELGDSAQIAALAITNCLNPTNAWDIQVNAILALGDLKACPQISLPVLISCLKSTDQAIPGYAAMALAKFGSQATNAIPALTNALTDSNIGTRTLAGEALRQIDPATFTNATPR
jgi:HEAT repeat protein